MPRVLLVLVLAFAVGVGFVGRDAACADDDCGMGAGAGDAGGGECPPFCGGCARVAVQEPPGVALLPVTLLAETVVATTPAAPLASPPRAGLFRPPRAAAARRLSNCLEPEEKDHEASVSDRVFGRGVARRV